jgi:hypothetical protein
MMGIANLRTSRLWCNVDALTTGRAPHKISNASNFLNAFVDYIKLTKVMFVHREGFFRESGMSRKGKPLRRTNQKNAKTVDMMGKKKGCLIMPRPGTKVIVPC